MFAKHIAIMAAALTIFLGADARGQGDTTVVQTTYVVNDAPKFGWGLAVGGARGDNWKSEQWGLYYQGHIRWLMAGRQLYGQMSMGYSEFRTPGVYNAETLFGDVRLMLFPFSLMGLKPFMYGGLGLTKQLVGGHSVQPLLPLGVGAVIQAGAQTQIEFEAGYNLVIGDDLDGKARTGDNLNPFTNAKHDAWFGFLIGVTFTTPTAVVGDPDEDGLSTVREQELGTNPKRADTDGDGLSDGEEVNRYHTDPLRPDTDGDGLSDGDEVNIHKTDPLNPDTDGDGLNDGDEVKKYKTDPNNPDTDGDGLKDGDEVNIHKTDPTNPDSDGDGAKDGEEIKERSDPSRKDSDGDGLWDDDEINRHRTDPQKLDTDGDGLNDGDEVVRHRTDPLKVDTDGGGANDAVEVQRGTDPLDPTDD